MVKSKSLWYGIGFGIMVGALLLQLFTAAETTHLDTGPAADPRETSSSPDSEELERAAEQNGFRLVSKDDKLYTQSEVEDLRRQWQNELPPPAEKEIRSVFIIEGMTSEQTAELLHAAELLVSPDDFLQKLTDRELHSKVRAGIYRFENVPSMQELIERITD